MFLVDTCILANKHSSQSRRITNNVWFLTSFFLLIFYSSSIDPSNWWVGGSTQRYGWRTGRGWRITEDRGKRDDDREGRDGGCKTAKHMREGWREWRRQGEHGGRKRGKVEGLTDKWEEGKTRRKWRRTLGWSLGGSEAWRKGRWQVDREQQISIGIMLWQSDYVSFCDRGAARATVNILTPTQAQHSKFNNSTNAVEVG